MKYEINWSKIKNSHKGFESLAVRYVQMAYDPRFKGTSETRDGNKDAVLEIDEYTVILGYKPSQNSTEEWWMEAKYSQASKHVTRYRLDATLVSALLKGNVGRIVFVTNININSQTINDVRQAITSTTVCKEVNFCTRDTLEYWLYQNQDILKEFFPDYQYEPLQLSNLILVEPLEFFTLENNGPIFKESLRVLDLNETYCANCTVYSQVNQTLSLKLSNGLKGIKNKQPTKRSLKIGINTLHFCFTIKSNYGYKSKKKQLEHGLLPEPTFTLGELAITCKDTITVNAHFFSHYKIPSQEKMVKKMVNYFNIAYKIKGTYLFYLYGQSGVGKSYVLDNYIKFPCHFKAISFICEMTGNYQQDLKNLMHCINFIYFPYLPSDNITQDYLRLIADKNYLPAFYYDIIDSNDNEATLSKLLYKYISENISLFPRRLYVNSRQIIIDNINSANNLIINVLYKIVTELSMIRAPFNIIFSGQQIQHTAIYSELTSVANVKERELLITVDDCLSLLPPNSINNELKIFLESNQLFSNMIELLMFMLYLQDHGKELRDIQTFQILYGLFFQDNIMDVYLKRLINSAISNDVKASNLCNKVYWQPHGIERTDTDEERKLLCYRVIKLDVNAQKIVPYHDIYAKFYRKNFACSELTNIPLAQLLDSGNYDDIRDIAEKLHNEYEKKNYILVYYTLEPIFREHSTFYKNLMDDTTYYRLFQDFAHSCSFCSIDYSGAKLFLRIYNETKLLINPSSQIQLVKNAALWELTNSTFESLDYDQAKRYCEELLQDTQNLVNRGIIKGTLQDSVRYHNVNVIKSMIMSELLENDYDFFYTDTESKMNQQENRLWSFRVRYSLTLLQRDPKRGIDILSQCRDHYEQTDDKSDKYYLWSSFYLSYTKMIVCENDSQSAINEAEALSILEEMKDLYFNDYRKMLYGIILYFYYTGKKEQADLYLLKDCYVLRDKRPRLKGFEYLINALRYVIDIENVLACDELQKAYTIFKHISSYGDLIQHNINLLISLKIDSVSKIKYYFGGTMEEDVYYLDIRGCW